jgi:hypothetical protein
MGKNGRYANSPAIYGGLTAMTLVGLVLNRDIKVKPCILSYAFGCSWEPIQLQATLSALAALAKDNPAVAAPVAKNSSDKDGMCVFL